MGGRGSCRRKRSLRCSRCYNENVSNYILGLGGIVWENVDAVKRVGNYYFADAEIAIKRARELTGSEFINNG